VKQLLQSLKTGETRLETIPAPTVGPGQVLIRTSRSLVSLGTEKMLVEFGKASLIAKARQQPDKVKQVLDKIATEGLLPTLENVFRKLDQPLPLGYCNVGRVIALGEGVTDLALGDRVVSNGPHAEIVAVPRNLVARVPEGVSDEEAAFTVIGAIGLQGIRLCEPTFGERIAVIGLGLIGLLTAQLLKAQGCQVIGIEIDPQKVAFAEQLGIRCVSPNQAARPAPAVLELTEGIGADGVIITASAPGDTLISQAATMSRKRGRIILIGVIGLNLNRADFYEKELRFQVSCSYGPGRYDEAYEQKGIDYPLPYVRWTEQRNFVAILQAMAGGQLVVAPLVTERVPLDEYKRIYAHLGQSSSIASILVYPEADPTLDATRAALKGYDRTVTLQPANLNAANLNAATFTPGSGGIGVIGAGNFTNMTLLPTLNALHAPIKTIASAGGVNALSLAKKYGIPQATTDLEALLDDPSIDLVIITTRHHQHAEQVTQALRKGKHVFVEKPLAITQASLEGLIDTWRALQAESPSMPTLTVGFNRRWSPHTQAIKRYLGDQPMHIIATMNAGAIPIDHWVHDPAIGGGRLIGEACHYLDLCAYLAGSPITSVATEAVGTTTDARTDNATIFVKMANGSQATIHYVSAGHRSYPKERIEVHQSGRTMVIDQFRQTQAFGVPGFRGLKTAIDKGHRDQFKTLLARLREGGPALIPFESLVNTSRAALQAITALQYKQWMDVPPLEQV